MKSKKTYKIIVPYTESAAPYKKYKIEYVVKAENRNEAKILSEKEFDSYSHNNSASWVRIPDESSIRIWRVFPNDPTTPQFIDELIQQIPCKDQNKTINVLQRLGELEDSTASSKVISQIKTDNPQIVATAIYTLGSIGDPTSFFAVKNAYFQKKDSKIKEAVVKTLLKLALPDDNVLDFYITAIRDKATRQIVFDLEDSVLIPVWLAEISNDQEFEIVKKHVLKLGEKALMVLSTLNVKHPKVFSYAAKLVEILKPIAIEKQWDDLPAALKKYEL